MKGLFCSWDSEGLQAEYVRYKDQTVIVHILDAAAWIEGVGESRGVLDGYQALENEICLCNETHINHGDDFQVLISLVGVVVYVENLERNLLAFYSPQVCCSLVVPSRGTCTCETYFLISK